ncbi:MAG: Crp/Fnr family transcriptional regulator [Bacteroidia bacterium]
MIGQNQLFEFIEQYVSLANDEKQAIIDLNLFKHYKKGDLLLKEGDSSNKSYLVLSGCIRCYYIVEGDEKTTEFYTEMQGIEPTCVVTGNPSEYYLACVEDSLLAVSSAEMEPEIFAKFPKFETMCRVLSAEKLVKNQIEFDDFKTSSPEQRYEKLLESRPYLLQRVPQHQLASYLGIKPQSLSRIRSRIANK